MLISKHSVHIHPYLSAGGSSTFNQISEKGGGGFTGPQLLEGVDCMCIHIVIYIVKSLCLTSKESSMGRAYMLILSHRN